MYEHRYALIHLLAIAALAMCIALPTSSFAEDAEDDTVLGADLGVDLPWTRVSTKGAIYESPRFGGESRLFIKDDDNHWRVYRGADYKRIVETNPDLGAESGITILGRRLGIDLGIELPDLPDLPKPPIPLPGTDDDEPKQPKVEKVTPTKPVQYRGAMTSYVVAPHMTYEMSSLHTPNRLYVRRGDAEYVYVGENLDVISKRYPQVKKQDGFDAFSKRVAHAHKVWRVQPRTKTTHYVRAWDKAGTYKVEVWNYHNGTWSQKTYVGSKLDEIVVKHEEARPVLHTWTTIETPVADNASEAGMKTETGRDSQE